MIRHEVVIIGGSLAGASCAMELRQAGVDVVAFDRDRFPRRKVCGEFLSPGAVRSLRALGVLEAVRRAGAVSVERARVRSGRWEMDIPFERLALGFSRQRLDSILARRAGVHTGCSVEWVRPRADKFAVGLTRTDGGPEEVICEVVIDAAGKLSRFSPLRSRPQYGVQFHERRRNGAVLDFRFFDGGYGGSVSVEDGWTNSCFLIDKSRVRDYIGIEGCMVTGPIAYQRNPGSYLAIGDASGMIDPFCGEGMNHALESGRMAGRIVAAGRREGLSYEGLRGRYEAEWRRKWRRKRAIASIFRWALQNPNLFRTAFAAGSRVPNAAAMLLYQMWK